MKYDIVIGIDPDIDKSGIGTVDTRTRLCTMSDATFPELISRIDMEYQSCLDLDLKMIVVVEAGWLNKKASWHIRNNMTKAACSKLGYDVGRNHEAGILICEMLEAMGIPYKMKKPLKKIWKGTDGKITHNEIVAVTGFKGKTSNQEKRDALLLAWDEAELPMRMKL